MVSFAGMSWEPDRLCWRSLTFRLEDPARPMPGSDGLILWKSRGLVEQKQVAKEIAARLRRGRIRA